MFFIIFSTRYWVYEMHSLKELLRINFKIRSIRLPKHTLFTLKLEYAKFCLQRTSSKNPSKNRIEKYCLFHLTIRSVAVNFPVRICRRCIWCFIWRFIWCFIWRFIWCFSRVYLGCFLKFIWCFIEGSSSVFWGFIWSILSVFFCVFWGFIWCFF